MLRHSHVLLNGLPRRLQRRRRRPDRRRPLDRRSGDRQERGDRGMAGGGNRVGNMHHRRRRQNAHSGIPVGRRPLVRPDSTVAHSLGVDGMDGEERIRRKDSDFQGPSRRGGDSPRRRTFRFDWMRRPRQKNGQIEGPG